MSDFTTALDAALPKPTAGALPSTRTFHMMTEAIESKDVDRLAEELQHTRAHYQSLEFMLNSEERIIKLILRSFEESEEVAPTPTTLEEAVRLTARVYATEVLMAAYDTAHQLALLMELMGLNVQEVLQLIYGDLDHSDPGHEDEELSLANEIAAFLKTLGHDEA